MHRPSQPASPSFALRPACSWAAVSTSAMLAAVVIAISGCAATPAGSTGADAFMQEATPVLLSGPRAAAEAAQCFEEQGRFLPLSEFSNDSAASRHTYRLRVAGLWFEQVRITTDGAGSLAEWRLAPNLDAQWQAQFERDRLAALRRCLGS